MAVNKYKVKPKAWKTWTLEAQQVFNVVYSTLATNQKLFLHPKTVKLPRPQWNTTAWNAAWIAADAVDGRQTEVEEQA